MITGNKIRPLLKRVTNDVNEYPLDSNDKLTSLTMQPQATMANPTSSPDYKTEDLSSCPVPVKINFVLTRNAAPYVDGSISLNKNGSNTDLITFVGSGVSAGNYHLGDTLTVNTFHYHLSARWPDIASLTTNIRIGNVSGKIIKTNTGGSVNVADVFSYGFVLTHREYTIEVFTFSDDASLKNPPMGYSLVNNTSIPDGVLKVSAVDDATNVYWLGENPSELDVPANGSARLGAYNMPIAGATQSFPFQNGSGQSVTVNITTIPNGGAYTHTAIIAAGASYTFPLADKVGFILTVDN